MSDWRAQAERAGHTVAFLNADVTVGGKVPHFLLMPPRIADRFHELHPEAKRLSLSELEKFIETKYGDPANNETELTNGQGS
jgi:hypothetical protein